MIMWSELFSAEIHIWKRAQNVSNGLFTSWENLYFDEDFFFKALVDKPLNSWKLLSIKKCNQFDKEFLSL